MKEDNKIAVGIVLYNPEDWERILTAFESISAQTECIYIYDNSFQKYEGMLPEKTVYMSEGQNKGLAYGLNRLMERAEKDGFQWLITMDQDSVIPDGMLLRFNQCIAESGVGIVCPQVIDRRRLYMKPKAEPATEYVDFCITSASCTSIEAWKTVGKFDEWLFVDLIDNDFCKRIRCSGYNIVRCNDIILDQEFGKIVPKSPKQQQFWIWLSELFHCPNLAKFSYKKFVSPVRVYYTNRNILYVNKKLKAYGPVAYSDNYNCRNYLGFLVAFSLPSLLRAQEKTKVLRAIIRGTKDGLKIRVKPWSAR